MVYVGSKSRLAKYIVPILQKEIDKVHYNTFIDCCVGGSNIIDKIKCENKIGIDNNKYLIALYNKIKETDFTFPEKPTQETFNDIKANPDAYEDWYVGLVAFTCSFCAGGLNAGYIAKAGDRDYYAERCRNLAKQIPLLKDISYICSDFSIIRTYKDCVIYIDPPYFNAKRKYDTSKNFDYNRFWETVREVSIYNKVFVSETTVPPDFTVIWEKSMEKHFKSNKVVDTEKLVTLKFDD